MTEYFNDIQNAQNITEIKEILYYIQKKYRTPLTKIHGLLNSYQGRHRQVGQRFKSLKDEILKELRAIFWKKTQKIYYFNHHFSKFEPYFHKSNKSIKLIQDDFQIFLFVVPHINRILMWFGLRVSQQDKNNARKDALRIIKLTGGISELMESSKVLGDKEFNKILDLEERKNIYY